MSTAEFEVLVADALDSLPVEFQRQMDNVVVLVADANPERDLYGLYRGIDRTKRTSGYVLAAPDTITIYRLPIISRAPDVEWARNQVRRTVIHEVAHHFGIGDDQLRAWGW